MCVLRYALAALCPPARRAYGAASIRIGITGTYFGPTADFTMPQERVGQRRKAPPRAGKVPGGVEGRFSLRKRPAERP